MRIDVLSSSWARARGAMFRSTLRGRILVFCYPRPVRHLFHTFFCPPLRITALNQDGEPSFSTVTTSGTFVRLPPARIVLETAPDVSPEDAIKVVRSRRPEVLTIPIRGQGSGSVDRISPKRLFFAALVEPMRVLRSFWDNLDESDSDEQTLVQQLPRWKQGRLLEASACVVKNSDVPGVTIPLKPFQLAKSICSLVFSGRRAEVTAAGLAGGPWPDEFTSPLCLRCHNPCTWRQVVSPHEAVPADMHWRYDRPENAVPLCRNCVRLKAWNDPQSRQLIALGLWGARFDAFLQWHNDAVAGMLPASWDRIEYPLWPKRCGGDTWATGSGAWRHAIEMRLPTTVVRRQVHRMFLPKLLGTSVDDLPWKTDAPETLAAGADEIPETADVQVSTDP